MMICHRPEVTQAPLRRQEGEVSMVNHGPNCLEGPVSRMSPWWAAASTGGSRHDDAQKDPRNSEDRPIRGELVDRVRREIAAGTYDTPEKWQAALDRLFDCVGQG